MSRTSPSDDDPSGTGPRPPDGRRGLVPLLVFLGGLCLLGWFVRPWLHAAVYALYTTPTLVVPVALAAAAAWVLNRSGGSTPFDAYDPGDRGGSDRDRGPLRVAVVVLVVTGVVTTSVVGAVAGETLSDRTLAAATETDTLSDVDADRPRIVPRAVADRYASNTLNRPQFRAGPTDITVANGTPYWAAPLSPDGVFNLLTKEQGGTVLVDMTTQQARVRTVDGAVDAGIGTVFYENYRWRLLTQGEYLVDYGDPKMVVHDGAQYVMVPYARPTFHLTPVPHSTPTWGGVALLDAEGTVEVLSPEAAAAHPALEGQQLYPAALAREKVAATKYRNGILNTYTAHEGEIEVAAVPGQDNDQPFFVLSEDGPQYVVAVEPYGEAQGLREVWTVDGRTGRFEVFRPTDSLFGPRKAADLVRQSAPQTDWDRFYPAEPILTVVDDRPYWQVRVVPDDNSGIAYVAFVNARTSDVREFDRTGAIRTFLAGGTPVNRTAPDDGGDATTDRAPSVVVERVAANGTVVETMTVYGNETVRVRTANASATR
jgi:hypothetical protein